MVVRPFPASRNTFSRCVEAIKAAQIRPEVIWQEIPAPARLAPFSFAAEADVEFQDEDVANGRFILLHDPKGQDSWQGQFRIVTLVQAELEPEFAIESMLGDVAWSWVQESLELFGAEADELGCTVTRVVSQSYGALAGRPSSVDVELRTSWTPRDISEIDAHFGAWSALLCAAGGLPPAPVGIQPISASHRAWAPHCDPI